MLNTYPIYKSALPTIHTRSQLLSLRKENNNDVKPFENVFRLEVKRINAEGFVEKPKFSSYESIKSEYKQTLRTKAGMAAPSDIKTTKIPGMEYVTSPKYGSQSNMKEEKKKELLKNLHEKADYDHLNRDYYLWQREKYLISHNLPGKESLTIRDIKEKKRLETNSYNSKTFSNLSIGVHGKELPKFSENLNEY